MRGLRRLVPQFVLRCAPGYRLRLFESQFAECLRFVGRAMRAGHSFSMAIEMVPEEFAGPVAEEFRRLSNEYRLGVPLDDALTRVAERVVLFETRLFTTAVIMQKDTGGNLAEILDHLADLLHERLGLKEQIRRMERHHRGLVASIIGFAVLGTAVAWLARWHLLDPPVGLRWAAWTGAVAAGLQVVGYLWMLSRAVSGAVRRDLGGYFRGRRGRTDLAVIADCIDFLTVCVSAGLGLDQALTRAVKEFERSSPDLSGELACCLDEMRRGKRRAEALRRLAERSSAPAMKSLVAALIQADRFGTNLDRLLSNHARALRASMRDRAQAEGRGIWFRLSAPLVLCMLPSIGLVLAPLYVAGF